MALAISSSQGVNLNDPTSSLRKALSAFEDCLTDEQKHRFRAQTAASPTEKAVAFAQQIDTEKSPRRRCAFSRIIRLLDATKQFSDIVDTFVGSNSAIAGLVWGSLKTAILVASNVCSSFEYATELIMKIGKSCPAYKSFAKLYPSSVGLQGALSAYFAIIVRICIKVVEVSQRNTLSRAFSSIINPFESVCGPLRDELREATEEIHLQISLAENRAVSEMKSMHEDEIKRNALFRFTSTKLLRKAEKNHSEARQWQLQALERELETLRSRIRDNFSTIKYDDSFRQVMGQRVCGTAEWLQRDPTFKNWLSDSDSSFLWCTGTMGIGKTVLIANVIAQLQALGSPTDILAYYICCPDNEQTLQSRHILGTLIRQLLDKSIETAGRSELTTMHGRSNFFDPTDTAWWVTHYIEDGKAYFIIVDGLDDCQDDDLRQIDKFLAAMLQKHPQSCKIICTGRPELESRFLRTAMPKHKLSISQTKVKPDMDRYITATLDGCIDEGRLRLTDPTLQQKIGEVLRERADGMFLWTRLVIEELCAQPSDHDILEGLEHLPRSLAEIFDRTIARIKRQSTGETATRLLQYCGVVKQPLDLTQYKEVLAVFPGQKSVERTRYPNNMDTIISNCYGLLFVDEDRETVHFTHRSIQQYLFTNDSLCKVEFNSSRINVNLGTACMTYLNFVDFKRQIAKTNSNSKMLFEPKKLGILPASSLNGHLGGLIRRRWQDSQSSAKFDMQEVVKKTQKATGSTVLSEPTGDIYEEEFRFMRYAERFWIYHSADLSVDTFSQTWILFRRCVEGNDVLANHPWKFLKDLQWRKTPIPKITGWLLSNKNHALLLYQIRHQQDHLVEDVRKYILYRSADLNLFRFTETMIQSGINQSEDLQYGLRVAAEAGRLDAFERYRKAGADIHLQNEGETMLQAAAVSGSIEILTVLLRARLDPDACGSGKKDPPLRLAVRNNRAEAVEMLLHAGAKVDEPTGRHGAATLLQEAASNGYLDIVDSLLTAGADVNAAACEDQVTGRTALQAAAEKGHYEVVVRLLDAGADVNAPPHIGWEARSALQWAARSGNFRVVDILLDAGADINAPAYEIDGCTALQAAADGDHVDIVRRLLASGAEVNAAYNQWGGHSALQHAARQGNMEMVSVLLDAGADVNAPASKERGATALQSAVQDGYLEVIKQLLAAGADVDAPGSQYGGTALRYAIHRQRTEIEQILRRVSNEASTNAQAN